MCSLILTFRLFLTTTSNPQTYSINPYVFKSEMAESSVAQFGDAFGMNSVDQFAMMMNPLFDKRSVDGSTLLPVWLSFFEGTTKVRLLLE